MVRARSVLPDRAEPTDQHVRAVIGEIELDLTGFADAHSDAQPFFAARAPPFADPAGVEPITIISERHLTHRRQGPSWRMVARCGLRVGSACAPRPRQRRVRAQRHDVGNGWSTDGVVDFGSAVGLDPPQCAAAGTSSARSVIATNRTGNWASANSPHMAARPRHSPGLLTTANVRRLGVIGRPSD